MSNRSGKEIVAQAVARHLEADTCWYDYWSGGMTAVERGIFKTFPVFSDKCEEAYAKQAQPAK